jgi:hypothetical protein
MHLAPCRPEGARTTGRGAFLMRGCDREADQFSVQIPIGFPYKSYGVSPAKSMSPQVADLFPAGCISRNAGGPREPSLALVSAADAADLSPHYPTKSSMSNPEDPRQLLTAVWYPGSWGIGLRPSMTREGKVSFAKYGFLCSRDTFPLRHPFLSLLKQESDFVEPLPISS